MSLATLERRVKAAERFAALPGVKVKEVRNLLDLPPLPEYLGELVINLPPDPRRG